MNETQQINGAQRTDVAALSDELALLSAGKRIEELSQRFPGRVVASTSFGLQAAVMLKLVKDHAPEVPVVFIDTGYLFDETYRYAVELSESLGLDIKVYRPKWSPAWQEAVHGKLWEQGAEGNEKYSLLNKVEPMNRAIEELGAQVWLSGLRRSHSKTRVERPFAEQQSKTMKAYPILDWDDEQVENYFRKYQLPKHPLADEYVTMGDWHSTKKVSEANSAEETRFGGEKYECGLHLNSGVTDFQI
ncbi:phosphoadenylyl-sulfate reductase [Roseibacillus persicicus]|uniref:Phosphoadenosine 5'-phosphosulfate reductase n=1 Tax=Roseibacillus persicicus TaxID=454148 RepID=A0A918WFU2_9BACT|nr:phosphoadenylyl-sulfate reductase [Roseibacillus persicicus]GHC47428.1 phosphoadenosine phosphosulfate reductase [Roseibacillus persicicus]